jgi:hypothetical protein
MNLAILAGILEKVHSLRDIGATLKFVDDQSVAFDIGDKIDNLEYSHPVIFEKGCKAMEVKHVGAQDLRVIIFVDGETFGEYTLTLVGQ